MNGLTMPVLGVTLPIIVASLLVFWKLMRRETGNRTRREIKEWARRERFRRSDEAAGVPTPLSGLRVGGVLVRWNLHDKRTNILLLETYPHAGGPSQRWNLWLVHVETQSHVGGYRPSHAAHSIADLLEINPSPHEPAGARFIVLGDDLQTSRRLASSNASGLLPADIGLVRLEYHVLLDFSARPFDAIELTRIRSIADQIVSLV